MRRNCKTIKITKEKCKNSSNFFENKSNTSITSAVVMKAAINTESNFLKKYTKTAKKKRCKINCWALKNCPVYFDFAILSLTVFTVLCKFVLNLFKSIQLKQ